MQLVTLSSGEVHLWLTRLDQEVPPATAELSPPERDRAASFLRPEAAGRWIAARLALRRVLSEYLGGPPEEIGIVAAENGKPRLAQGGPEFNLAHSGELALIAVSPGPPVGVDLEKIEPARDLVGLAERALDAADAASVRAAPPAQRPASFYAAWTRHEARLKCLGTGLAGPAPESPVAVQNLDVAPGYAAAVAVAGEEVGRVRCRSLRPR